MVPFPSAEYYTDPLDKRKRLKTSWANDYLREHPDGNGLLLPRMKEEIRKDEAWRTILGPTHDAVQVVGKGGWKDAVAHGLAEYWTKVAFAAGGVDPKHAYLAGAGAIKPKMHDKKRYETLEHHLFEEETISERMKAMYDVAQVWGIPPETAKKLAAAYPDFLRAAIALSNVAERAYEYGYGKEAHKKFLQGILKPAEIDALIEIMESKITPPHYLVKKFARPEELEAIYKVHKRFLDMFPHLFEEKKTPFEELIPEERRKELDEIIELENKLAEGVIKKKILAEYILPERKEKRLVQLKKEHYLDALRRLGLVEEKPSVTHQKPITTPTAQSKPSDPLAVRKEKERFTIHDVDMSKVEKHPETGLPIIRNGDQIVVLPPHKHPKEIPNVHEEAKDLGIHAIVRNGIRDGASIQDVEQIGNEILRLMKWVREEAIHNPNRNPDEIMREAAEKWEKIKEKYTNKAANNKGVRIMLISGRRLFKIGAMTKKEIPTYTSDHLATEIAAGEVALAEAIKIAKDMYAHPEKYGLDKVADDKARRIQMIRILSDLFHNKKKVIGFPHKEKVLGEW